MRANEVSVMANSIDSAALFSPSLTIIPVICSTKILYGHMIEQTIQNKKQQLADIL
jgi:hypothetical protein